MGLSAHEAVQCLRAGIDAKAQSAERAINAARREVVDAASGQGVGLSSRRFVLEAEAVTQALESIAIERRQLVREVLHLVTTDDQLPAGEVLARALEEPLLPLVDHVSSEIRSKAATFGLAEPFFKHAIDAMPKRLEELAAENRAVVDRLLIERRNELHAEASTLARESAWKATDHKLAIAAIVVSAVSIAISLFALAGG